MASLFAFGSGKELPRQAPGVRCASQSLRKGVFCTCLAGNDVFDSNLAFQHWVLPEGGGRVPAGTKNDHALQPQILPSLSGRAFYFAISPSLKRLGYFQ
jgi:hypothetical protein